MSKSRTKKPIPLDGESLSTGVLIAKATATQLKMEVNRLIKIAVQRVSEPGVQFDLDEQCQKAHERAQILLNLCKERLYAEADAHGIDRPQLDHEGGEL